MKNNPPVLKGSAASKFRIAGLIAISVFVLVCIILAIFKAADHRGELKFVLQSRNHERLEELLKAHPGLVDAQLQNRNDKDLWTPLHMAACYGDNNSIEILLRHKAKVNAKDVNGLTPLHYTVSLSRYQSAQLLINKGADINAKGRDGRTPMELARMTRDTRMMEMFRIRGARE